jgi:AcrR family transcriptional regulator
MYNGTINKNERGFTIVQILKDEVKNSINNAAVECFIEMGYEKASMREISKRSGLSVGNLYRYFPNKEALFDFVVSPAVKLLDERPMKPKAAVPFLDINMMQEMELIEAIIQARIANHDAMFILFLRSKGTKYENIKKKFAKLIEEQSIEFIEKEFKNDPRIIDGDLYHRAASAAFVEGFLVILEEAEDEKSFIRNLIQFIELNVKAIARHMYNVRDNKVQFRRINHEEIYKHFSSHCDNRGDSSTEDN